MFVGRYKKYVFYLFVFFFLFLINIAEARNSSVYINVGEAKVRKSLIAVPYLDLWVLHQKENYV